eukprot:TRINITY_DN112127_c0_g1_i1.p1 TRINITY_DN112127_c0_g1~~TRINITY_DN112127_c0_g1_i1.p1  ORF type:complete len:728 (-),score=155.00 TRINITY_DN112127_c0_g1_i1:266-2449(-)
MAPRIPQTPEECEDKSGDEPIEDGGSDDEEDDSQASMDDDEDWTPPIQCTAGGKRLQESNWTHCRKPQSFVRCGPHHRAKIQFLDKPDVDRIYDVWTRYRDDLTNPWYDKKPQFADEDFDTLWDVANKVVDKMIEEYGEPMVLDQCTVSNTNWKGHPPHADNVQFDSVWWEGKKIRQEDELAAARDGAYVLFRSEKTSYRSYSCTVALSDPNGYEGGEVQFFNKWGDKDPVESVKCEIGQGACFCGCQKNIHAVTGVKSGFRLVFLVWTRPPHVRPPESQLHVCYFRPGTGRGVWLTTQDVLKRLEKDAAEGKPLRYELPTEEDDPSCMCQSCVTEREKLAWKDRDTVHSIAPTPSTTAGDSSHDEAEGSLPSSEQASEMRSAPGLEEACRLSFSEHCPHEQAEAICKNHSRVELPNVVTESDIEQLWGLWETYHDDLNNPWYEKKPEFSNEDFETFRRIAEKVVKDMSARYNEPLVLDQATLSCTSNYGHPPHVDNLQFDSVWWRGRRIKQRDELRAAREGAAVLWKTAKTSYRNYAASISLTDPDEYKGGDLEFFDHWGQKDAVFKTKLEKGNGLSFCGCQKCIHAVTGVPSGWRFVLLIWTRPPDSEVPESQKHVCYFRQGTGKGVWLTTADLQRYPSKRARATGKSQDRRSRRRGGRSSWSWSGSKGSKAEGEDWEEEEEESDERAGASWWHSHDDEDQAEGDKEQELEDENDAEVSPRGKDA